MALAKFMADGDLQQHIRRCHAAYAAAARTPAARASRTTSRRGSSWCPPPPASTWPRSRGGRIDMAHAAQPGAPRRRRASIRWRGFYHFAPPRDGLMLGFGAIDDGRHRSGAGPRARRAAADGLITRRRSAAARRGSPPASSSSSRAAALSSAPSRSPRSCTADFITCCTTGAIARSVLRSACGAWRARIASTRSRTLRRTPATSGDGGPGRSTSVANDGWSARKSTRHTASACAELRRGQRRRALGQAVQPPPQRVHLLAHQRVGHGLLGAEELVQRADGRLGLRGDLGHRRGVEALGGEHLGGRGQQRLHAQLPARAARRARGVGRGGGVRRGWNPLDREGRWTFVSVSS